MGESITYVGRKAPTEFVLDLTAYRSSVHVALERDGKSGALQLVQYERTRFGAVKQRSRSMTRFAGEVRVGGHRVLVAWASPVNLPDVRLFGPKSGKLLLRELTGDVPSTTGRTPRGQPNTALVQALMEKDIRGVSRGPGAYDIVVCAEPRNGQPYPAVYICTRDAQGHYTDAARMELWDAEAVTFRMQRA